MKQYLDNTIPYYGDIIDATDKYYPIGEKEVTFTNSSTRSEIIINKFKDTKTHVNWKQFLNCLQSNFPNKVNSLSTSQEPSYSVEIEIESNKIGHLESRLTLICSLSLLTPVYLIYGLEEVRLSRRYEGMKKPYSFLNNLVKIVSPVGLIESHYSTVKSQLVNFFSEAKQVPFYVLEARIRDLYLDDPTQESSVFDALFSGLGHSHIQIHGDPYYSKDEWA